MFNLFKFYFLLIACLDITNTVKIFYVITWTSDKIQHVVEDISVNYCNPLSGYCVIFSSMVNTIVRWYQLSFQTPVQSDVIFYCWEFLSLGWTIWWQEFFFQMWLWSVLLLQYIYIHCVFVVCTFFALINIHCYLYTQSWADDVCWWFLWSIDVINRNRKRLNKK